MTPQDEKDLQQILFLAARILERQHASDGRSFPPFAPIASPNAPPLSKADGEIIRFPDLRADGKDDPTPPQKENAPVF